MSDADEEQGSGAGKEPHALFMAEEMLKELVQLHASLMRVLGPLQDHKAANVPTVEKLREFLWSASREADSILDDLLMPRGLDLDKEDSSTAKRLRDFVAWRFFSPHPSGDPWEILSPGFDPEEGNLQVFYMHGRWFCTWIKLDEDMGRPEKETRVLLMVKKEQDGRLAVVEV
jgi:hypothetical protein